MSSSGREMDLFPIVKIQEIKEKNKIGDYTLVDFSIRRRYLLRPMERRRKSFGSVLAAADYCF